MRLTGVTLSEKWNTDNTLGTELSIEDKLAAGLKLSLDTVFVPPTGSESELLCSSSNYLLKMSVRLIGELSR